jgi:hypothetical protein
MKGLMFAVAGLGVGGAAYSAADSPDYDGIVRMSRAEVYGAFSAAAPEGTVIVPDTEELGRKVSVRIAKGAGKSIRYEVLFDDKAVVTADLTFASAGDTQTRMTAELDIDGHALGSAFETQGGMVLGLVPDSVIDAEFAELMGEMVAQVESGRSITPLGLSSLGVNRQGAGAGAVSASASVEQRRYAAQEARRRAVAPSTSTRPMTDPNQAARDHLNGRPQQERPQQERHGSFDIH